MTYHDRKITFMIRLVPENITILTILQKCIVLLFKLNTIHLNIYNISNTTLHTDENQYIVSSRIHYYVTVLISSDVNEHSTGMYKYIYRNSNACKQIRTLYTPPTEVTI